MRAISRWVKPGSSACRIRLVRVVVDGQAHVVEQRGVGEEHALRRSVPVEPPQLVEEGDGQEFHVPRVRPVHIVEEGQVGDREGAGVRHGRSPRVAEEVLVEQPLAQALARDQQLGAA